MALVLRYGVGTMPPGVLPPNVRIKHAQGTFERAGSPGSLLCNPAVIRGATCNLH